MTSLEQRLPGIIERVRAAGKLAVEESTPREDIAAAVAIAAWIYEADDAKLFFDRYARDNLRDGLIIARAVIADHYKRFGTDWLFRRVKTLPRVFVAQLAEESAFSNELKYQLSYWLTLT